MRDWMRRMQLKLSGFMYGRNGQDQLGMAVYLAALVLYIPGVIKRNPYLMIVSLACFCYGVFRAFSKNIEKRREENQAFSKLLKRPGKYITLAKLQWEYRKTHRYFMCRKCGQISRVPKMKKKIEITCPRCGRKFTRRA